MSLAHKDDYYETPMWLFNYLQEKTKLYFDLDVCADELNAVCNEFIDEKLNALEQEWVVHESPTLNTKCKKPELHGGACNGSRKTLKFWISYAFGWLPITIVVW